MIMISKFKRLWRNEDGVAAIELAIYSVAFFAMLFGGIYASILGFTSTSLHSAVEAAARCSALGITCTDATTTQNYAKSAFHNLTTVTPAFTRIPRRAAVTFTDRSITIWTGSSLGPRSP